MSSVTTTKVDTANGSTTLTITTGNTGGPSIVVNHSNTISFNPNSSITAVTVNTTSVYVNTSLSVLNNITANNLTISTNTTLGKVTTSNLTSNGTSSFTANVTFSGSKVTFNANVTAGTINASAIGLGTSSIGSSGYSRLPNGLIMQWGSSSITTATTTVTFPTAFSSTPFTIQLTGTVSDDSWITNLTSTNFTADTDVNQTVYWLAIGAIS